MSPTVMGRDLAAIFAGRLKGRLYSGVLTKTRPGTYDPSDVAAGTQPTTIAYACEGHAFKYDTSYVDREQITSTDYRVMILLGSIKAVDPSVSSEHVIPAPGDTISLPPPGQTIAQVGTVVKIETLTDVAVTMMVSGLTP